MLEPTMKELATSHRLTDVTDSFPGAELSVITEKKLIAVNFTAARAREFIDILGALPQPGKSTDCQGHHLLWTEAGQVFCFATSAQLGEATLQRDLGDTAYVTDLSDGWIAVSLTGENAQTLIDHVAMPDLSVGAFEQGAVTSTLFAHLRVIIWRNDSDAFTLLSTASSAQSFLHALRGELATAANYLERSHV
ncbi:MAG: hypothetical protein ABJH07_08030 [Sedimentitalea sp.]|uniref:hypothetical protein n=1 Tax=Sedimentitalea sp. TaxID=2048915 RepID=UPI0032636F0E